MGGHAAGEVASREAVDTLYGMVKRGIGSLRELVDPVAEKDTRAACRLLESAVQAATYFVYSIAEIDREKSGMGTTISALLILGDYAITAQVGDSRIYRIHEGAVEQLTEDHTLIAWQLKQGLITQEEAARSPHRNVITRAVGNREYVQVDTRCLPLADGVRFLLCSDGLHGYLKEDDIPAILGSGGAGGAPFRRLGQRSWRQGQHYRRAGRNRLIEAAAKLTRVRPRCYRVCRVDAHKRHQRRASTGAVTVQVRRRESEGPPK
jgi:protein phosphatase